MSPTAVSPVRRLLGGFASVVLGFGGLRVSLWAPERCPPLTASGARAAAAAAGDWIVRHQAADGAFRYEYDRRTGTVVPGYNRVRHAGTTMALVQLAAATGDDRYLAAADRALAWLADRTVDTGAGAGVAEPTGDVKLGTTALTTVALVMRRDLTADPVHDDRIAALARFMVGQRLPDGGMSDRWSPGAGTDPAARSRFSTGEALWALALVDERLAVPGVTGTVAAVAGYLVTERDRAEGLFPEPWPDQWAAYALWQIHNDLPGGPPPAQLDYARRLAARFGFIIRWDLQRDGGIVTLTHGFAPRGGASGTWLEGMASLWRLSRAVPGLGELEEPVARHLRCAAGRLVARQARGAADVDGAWFYDGRTRVDDQQHALSGLLLAESVLDGPRPEPGAVVPFNPARVPAPRAGADG